MFVRFVKQAFCIHFKAQKNGQTLSVMSHKFYFNSDHFCISHAKMQRKAKTYKTSNNNSTKQHNKEKKVDNI